MAVIPLCVMNVMINITQHHWIFSFSNFFEPHFKIAVCTSVIQTRAIHGSTLCCVVYAAVVYCTMLQSTIWATPYQFHIKWSVHDCCFRPIRKFRNPLAIVFFLVFCTNFYSVFPPCPPCLHAILISFGSRCGSFKFRYII